MTEIETGNIGIFDGMDETDILKVVNKKVTIAKRIWGQSKRETVYSDKIEREENELFKGDKTLAMLVIQREQIEKEIIERIDTVLTENR